jgi:hypothetical protein
MYSAFFLAKKSNKGKERETNNKIATEHVRRERERDVFDANKYNNTFLLIDPSIFIYYFLTIDSYISLRVAAPSSSDFSIKIVSFLARFSIDTHFFFKIAKCSIFIIR